MATMGDDCYFFCTSACVKGPSCQFRHVETAKTCKIVCQHWQMGNCFRPMCKFRHSTFPIPTTTTDTPCYWETQPVGCTKKTCPYKHSKQRPDSDTAKSVSETSGNTPDSNSVPKPGDSSQTPSGTAPDQESKDETGEKPSSQEPIKEKSIKINSPDNNLTVKSEDKSLVPADNDNSNKENGSSISGGTVAEKVDQETAGTPKTKKKIVTKTGGVKKKAAGTGVKKTKIVKRIIVRKVKKSAVKKLDGVTGDNNDVVKSDSAPVKKITERLGVLSPQKKSTLAAAPPKKSESDSDSSDSVDNIKVLSVEEILRQRALESMMKKRAAEAKPEQTTEATKGTKPVASTKKPTTKVIKHATSSIKPTARVTKPLVTKATAAKIISLKKKPAAVRSSPVAIPVRKKKVVPVTAPESSESEEEEEEEEASDDSSDSSSSEESEESSQESETDVRRVVVEVANEATARKRAKLSLLKQQASGAVRGVQAGRISKAKSRLEKAGALPDKKLRKVNLQYDSDDVVSSRLKAPVSVKDRLGKPPTNQREAVVKDSPRKTVVVAKAKIEKESSDSDEDDTLEGIKVKTLEEIRQEKMKNAALSGKTDSITGDSRTLSIKQRLGAAPLSKRRDSDDEGRGGRQVLIAKDTGSKSDDDNTSKSLLEQRKAKRRPWRSKKSLTSEEAEQGETIRQGDERTAIVVSSDLANTGDDSASQLERDQEETEVDESPFARLKRRALQRKLQSLQQLKESSLTRNIVQEFKSDEVEETNNDQAGEKNLQQIEGEEGSEEKRGDRKKHKHKHKHHKKSKKERQIYMPPALKHSAPDTLPTLSTSGQEGASPVAATAAPTIKVAPQRRGGPHPMAAAWAAGLSLSAKGAPLSVRRPQVQAVVDPVVSVPPPKEKVKVPEVTESVKSRPVAPMKRVISATSLNSTEGAVIKSFSEIMAEKRRRRLEMQGNQPGKAQNLTELKPSPYPTVASEQDLSEKLSWSPPRLKPVNETSSPIRAADPRPRVPITPIVFNTDDQSSSSSSSSSSVLKRKAQSWSSAPASIPPQHSHVPKQIVAPISSTASTVQSLPSLPSSRSDAQSNPSSLSSSASHSKSVKAGTFTPALKNSAKKLSGQKKIFKKKKQVESLGSSQVESPPPKPAVSPVSIDSVGISIPLPPMTMEEELLLDEGPQSSMDMEGSSESSSLQESQPIQQQYEVQQQTQSKDSVSPTFAMAAKHRLPSTDGSEASAKKKRLSLDDELDLFDMDGFGDEHIDSDMIVGDPLEPIDDLLQNIDDLLA
ncbi:hypothetical protein EGW08_020535 [Elysia chlorotica]|uniref:C3H1-type domain-containing protein n=1 Tax=Elysia chlorotica TaxID=188477 RepID=A0A433SR30_ELYCH|nr:hypothetical protein EGW08_020535 [Elysia chlorotica]